MPTRRKKSRRRGGASQTVTDRKKLVMEIVSILNYKRSNTHTKEITTKTISDQIEKLHELEVKALEQRIIGLTITHRTEILRYLYGKSSATTEPERRFLDEFRGELCSILKQYDIQF
jgi:hypothetical protein